MVFAKKLLKKTTHMCDNAPQYSVTAWGGGSLVIYNGKCFRARTVGAAGHQVPWDSSTYNTISGWDEIEREEHKCAAFGAFCVDCGRNRCAECRQGYALTQGGQSCAQEESSSCADFGANCVDCSRNACVECRAGFSLASNRRSCVRVNKCARFGERCNDCTLRKCVGCVKGFEITESGRCIASESHCEGTANWDRGIANGNKAPWTYRGGDVVQYNGVKYRATSGGQEVPGNKQCSNESSCPGTQWITVENC